MAQVALEVGTPHRTTAAGAGAHYAKPRRAPPPLARCLSRRCIPLPNRPMSVAVSLEACVRGAAAATAAASSVWADHCEAISIKHALQAQLLKPLLDPIYAKHGYPAALWCAFYSTVHPMGWENGDWYNTYMCPNERVCEPEALLAHPARWERQWQRCACTGREKLGDRDEAKGVPANVSLHGWHVPIFTLSCALCSHLHQRLGPAPFTAGHVPSPREPRTPERFKAMAKQYDESLGDFGFWHRWVGWNMYPFGAWFAGAVWPAQLDENSLEGLIAGNSHCTHEKENSRSRSHHGCPSPYSQAANPQPRVVRATQRWLDTD
eukprot:132596-Pleurochrysis_carterae.AAC.3